MEWVNDGARGARDANGPVSVVWWPAGSDPGEPGPRVVTQYVVAPEDGRHRVRSMTTYSAGEWEHEEPGPVSAELYRTHRLARAWAVRMAEMEAANPAAVAWDGEPA